jgi:site-specific recombinase
MRGLAQVVQEIEAVNLFAESGIPGDRGFLSELGDKALRKILPPPREDRDSGRILVRFFGNTRETDLLRRMPPDAFHQLVDLLVDHAPAGMWSGVGRDFGDAFRLLAARVKAEGLAPRLRARGPDPPVVESPFYRIDGASEALLKAWASGRGVRAAAERWFRTAVECREAVEAIRRRLETEGVNVNIVFGLEVIQRSLTRMETMVDVIRLPHGQHRSLALKDLMIRVITTTQLDRKISHVIGWNLQLLGRKIIERSGKTGEHYIARNRKEYWHIWLAAAGGGLLTTFTAAFKLTLVGAGLALFQEGFMVGLDYAISFLALQAFGLMLATKQPAMTAATLATITREYRGSQRIDEVVSFTARITHSQIAAAVSNVLVVAAGAYALDQAWRLAAGEPFLASSTATYVYTTLSPVNSGTVFYAALTGVILWLAALAGGWMENLSVYHRIPDGIRDHRWGDALGRERMNRLAGFWERNVSGWGTNISLGFMLGMTPAIGAFLGIPLDVRHVTLSTGMLALASAGLGVNMFQQGLFLLSVSGIATMFVLNLSVSFLLSLLSAARAYGFSAGELGTFLRTLGARFLKHPREFLLPPP